MERDEFGKMICSFGRCKTYDKKNRESKKIEIESIGERKRKQ